jgi:hypothetical protein
LQQHFFNHGKSELEYLMQNTGSRAREENVLEEDTSGQTLEFCLRMENRTTFAQLCLVGITGIGKGKKLHKKGEQSISSSFLIRVLQLL